MSQTHHSDPADPMSDEGPAETMFELSFSVPRYANPSLQELLAAIAATGRFVLEEGAGHRMQARIFGEPLGPDEPAEHHGASFCATPLDSELPMALVYAPDTDGETDGLLHAFSDLDATPGFAAPDDVLDADSDSDSDEDSGNAADFTFGDLELYITTDDGDVARACFATLTELMDVLQLHHATDIYGEHLIASNVFTVMDAWRHWREELEDVRAFNPADGSIRPDRVLGLTQRSISYNYSGEGRVIDADVGLGDHATLLVELPDGKRQIVVHGVEHPMPEAGLPRGMSWDGVVQLPGGGIALLGEPIDDDSVYGEQGRMAFLHPDLSVRSVASIPRGVCVATDHHLVVTYDDEQIFAGNEIMRQGVIAVNLDGKITVRYQRDIPNAVVVDDCYAAVHVAGDIVALCPYAEFPLILLDVQARTQTRIPTPEPHGASALTIADGVAYFHAPYDSSGIYRWEIGTASMEQIGVFPHRSALRGLPGGRFVSFGHDGYTLVAPLSKESS